MHDAKDRRPCALGERRKRRESPSNGDGPCASRCSPDRCANHRVEDDQVRSGAFHQRLANRRDVVGKREPRLVAVGVFEDLHVPVHPVEVRVRHGEPRDESMG